MQPASRIAEGAMAVWILWEMLREWGRFVPNGCRAFPWWVGLLWECSREKWQHWELRAGCFAAGSVTSLCDKV